MPRVLKSLRSSLQISCRADRQPERDNLRYRYAILCGGEPAKRALRTAPIDPSDSDEPGPRRRVVMATYDDYDDFLYRLPTYLADVTRDLEKQIGQTADADSNIRSARRELSAARNARITGGGPKSPG
jgi:hypothetical protein